MERSGLVFSKSFFIEHLFWSTDYKKFKHPFNGKWPHVNADRVHVRRSGITCLRYCSIASYFWKFEGKWLVYLFFSSSLSCTKYFEWTLFFHKFLLWCVKSFGLQNHWTLSGCKFMICLPWTRCVTDLLFNNVVK